ncbi:hypothetical protein Tco_1536891 [Tanacetum coccineum]
MSFIDIGEGSGHPTDPQHTSRYAQPFNEEQITAPSSSQPKNTYKCRKPKKVTEIPKCSEPTNLVTDEVVHEERRDSVEMAATTATHLDAEQDSGGRPRRQETIGDKPAQTRVLDLETTKTSQAKEIVNLKKRVKKLERKMKSRTLGMNLFKIVNTASAPVTTACVSVTTTEPSTPPTTTTTTIIEDEDFIIA